MKEKGIKRDELFKVLYKAEKDNKSYASLIITICGPIRLWDRIYKAKTVLNGIDLEDRINYLFLPVNLKANDCTEELKQQLVQLHKVKIDMADYVVIIGKEEEWGKDTLNEIEYAEFAEKKIVYWDL